MLPRWTCLSFLYSCFNQDAGGKTAHRQQERYNDAGDQYNHRQQDQGIRHCDSFLVEGLDITTNLQCLLASGVQIYMEFQGYYFVPYATVSPKQTVY